MRPARWRFADMFRALEALQGWRGLLAGTVQSRTAVIRRGDGPTSLFMLPARSNVVFIGVGAQAATGLPAGQSGIRLGVAGAPGYFLPPWDVGSVVGQAVPPARNLGEVGPNDVEVLGEYLETSPAAAGGPWGVLFLLTRD